jgi:hypothetical protein
MVSTCGLSKPSHEQSAIPRKDGRLLLQGGQCYRCRNSTGCRPRQRLRGKKPKLSNRQHKELRRMYDIGEYFIKERAEMFSISRPTVYRSLSRKLVA